MKFQKKIELSRKRNKPSSLSKPKKNRLLEMFRPRKIKQRWKRIGLSRKNNLKRFRYNRKLWMQNKLKRTKNSNKKLNLNRKSPKRCIKRKLLRNSKNLKRKSRSNRRRRRKNLINSKRVRIRGKLKNKNLIKCKWKP